MLADTHVSGRWRLGWRAISGVGIIQVQAVRSSPWFSFWTVYHCNIADLFGPKDRIAGICWICLFKGESHSLLVESVENLSANPKSLVVGCWKPIGFGSKKYKMERRTLWFTYSVLNHCFCMFLLSKSTLGMSIFVQRGGSTTHHVDVSLCDSVILMSPYFSSWIPKVFMLETHHFWCLYRIPYTHNFQQFPVWQAGDWSRPWHRSVSGKRGAGVPTVCEAMWKTLVFALNLKIYAS